MAPAPNSQPDSPHARPPSGALLSVRRGVRALTQSDAPEPPATIGTPGRRPAVRLAMAVAATIVIVALAAALALTWGAHLMGYRTHVIVGTSMEPQIPRYAVTVNALVPHAAISEGDVITFTPPGGGDRVTHRVTSIEFDEAGSLRFRTRGDANNAADPWSIRYDDGIAWLVVDHVPNLGRVLLWMQAPAGRVAFVVLPVLLLTVGLYRAARWRLVARNSA